MNGCDQRSACPLHPHHWRYRDHTGALRCSRCDGADCCTPEQKSDEDAEVRSR